MAERTNLLDILQSAGGLHLPWRALLAYIAEAGTAALGKAVGVLLGVVGELNPPARPARHGKAVMVWYAG